MMEEFNDINSSSEENPFGDFMNLMDNIMRIQHLTQAAKRLVDILMVSFAKVNIKCQFINVMDKRGFLIFPDGINDKILYNKLSPILTWDNGVEFDLIDADVVLIPIGDALFGDIERLGRK